MSHPYPPENDFPELRDWKSMGMHDAVFRASSGTSGIYVREDDGSAAVLRTIAGNPDLPIPRVVEQRQGWLVLGELPGTPLHHPDWLARPEEATRIIADALLRLARNDVTHGDMCVPNILGDVGTGRLTGIVDWGYAGQFDHEIDVASAVWSCGFNGYEPHVAIDVLTSIDWPRCGQEEVERLSRLWTDLAGPA